MKRRIWRVVIDRQVVVVAGEGNQGEVVGVVGLVVDGVGTLGVGTLGVVVQVRAVAETGEELAGMWGITVVVLVEGTLAVVKAGIEV